MVFNLIDILPAYLNCSWLHWLLFWFWLRHLAARGQGILPVTRISLGGILLALALIWFGAANDETAFGGMHRADSFADYMKILVLLGALGPLYVCHVVG